MKLALTALALALNLRLNFTRMFEDHSSPSYGCNPSELADARVQGGQLAVSPDARDNRPRTLQFMARLTSDRGASFSSPAGIRRLTDHARRNVSMAS